jgi:hypothetical protein
MLNLEKQLYVASLRRRNSLSERTSYRTSNAIQSYLTY